MAPIEWAELPMLKPAHKGPPKAPLTQEMAKKVSGSFSITSSINIFKDILMFVSCFMFLKRFNL